MSVLKRITNGTTTEKDTRSVVRFVAGLSLALLLVGFLVGITW